MRSSSGRVCRLAGMVAALAVPAASQGVLLERILAVVEGRPVLLSEVRVVQELRALPEKVALEALIDERLMLREAARLSQSAVSAEEEERALARLRETSAAARQAPEAELRRLVRRQTAILKYIDFRFRSQVSASEEDVSRAYEARWAGQAGAPPLEEVEPALRQTLLEAALDRRIETWVSELRASAQIRYNGPQPAQGR
jgi:hypothetical protein